RLGEGTAPESLRERFAGDELHHDVVSRRPFANLQHPRQRGMPNARERDRVAAETLDRTPLLGSIAREQSELDRVDAAATANAIGRTGATLPQLLQHFHA